MGITHITTCNQTSGGGGGGSVNSVSGAAPNVFITGTATDPIVNAGTQSWEFSGIITTPILSNAQNNYTQAGMADATTIRVFGDLFDPPFFTGLAGGTDGRILLVHNSSQDTPIYFLHNSASSTAANRIMSPGFVVDETFWSLPVNGLAVFQYDATDSRWRVIGNYVYKIIDDGSGVVTVGGDAQFPIVGFNGVFVDGVTITGNGTAGSPLTGSPSSDVLINQTIFVDPTYGDDGTAIPDSMTLKFKDIDAALAAWTSGYVIHLFPGVHTMNSVFRVTEVLNIFMEPNATLQTNTGTPAFSIDPAQRLHIYGYGDLELLADLCVNNTQSDPIPAEAHIQCRNINSSGAGLLFEPTSMIFTVEADGIYDRGFQGSGWCRGKVSVDFWTASSAKMIFLEAFTAANGEDKYTDYGPQQFIVKGRNRERCQWENLVAVNQIIYTQEGVEPYKSYLEFNVDWKCVDSFAVDPGRGTFVFNGHLHHGKTDTAGNEIPWIYAQQTISDQIFAPIVEHKWGSWISATNPIFAGSLNNEIASIAMPGKFIFNGQYENSGLNAGSGAWPILQFSNANPGTGQTTIILNGDFKSTGGDVAPIRIVDIGITAHTYKFIVKNCLIQTRFDYAIDTNAEMFIYVFHSLAMDKVYNPLITDGMSEDRTMIDTNVEVTVPGYGV